MKYFGSSSDFELAWNPKTKYKVGKYVIHKQKIYESLTINKNKEPGEIGNDTEWKVLTANLSDLIVKFDDTSKLFGTDPDNILYTVQDGLIYIAQKPTVPTGTNPKADDLTNWKPARYKDLQPFFDIVEATGKSIPAETGFILKSTGHFYYNHTTSASVFAIDNPDFTKIGADLEYHYIIATKEFTGATLPTGIPKGDYVFGIDNNELYVSNGDDSFKTFDKSKLQTWTRLKIEEANKLYKFKKADGTFEQIDDSGYIQTEYQTFNDIETAKFKEGDRVLVMEYDGNYHNPGIYKKDNAGIFKPLYLFYHTVRPDDSKDYWEVKDLGTLTTQEKENYEQARGLSYDDLRKFHTRHPSGLRKTIDTLANLKALTGKNFELRKVDENKASYEYKLLADTTQEEKDNTDNLISDDGNGYWILQASGVLVDFDYQLGNIVHAIPDGGKAIYEINGQTITDVKLAEYITDNPINGFSVNGNDVTTPDWRGRYIGATGARGLSASAGAIYSSANRSHAHDIRTDYQDSGASSQSGSIIGEANSNTNNTHRGTSKTRYNGSTYARPETAAMPICIVGGRVLNVLTKEVIIDPTVGQDDLVKYDLANNKLVPVTIPGLTADQEITANQSQDDDFVTYAFTGKPRHVTFQFQLYKDSGGSDYSYNHISVPFSIVKTNGQAFYTIASFNGVDPSYEEGVETAKIMIYVKYTDDTHIDLRVVKTGYEKNDGWNKRNYNLVKIVAEY